MVEKLFGFLGALYDIIKQQKSQPWNCKVLGEADISGMLLCSLTIFKGNLAT